MTAAAAKIQDGVAPSVSSEVELWLQDQPREEAVPNWIKALRATAAEVLATTGVPASFAKGWAALPLGRLTPASVFVSSATLRLPSPIFGNGGRIVLINGQYQPQLSTVPVGIKIYSFLEGADLPGLAEGISGCLGSLANDPWRALNAAHLKDGVIVKVEGEVDTPIEVLCYHAGQESQSPVFYPQLVYCMEPKARARIVERHQGEGCYFFNATVNIFLQDEARLNYTRVQQESESAVHFSHTAVQQHRHSVFEGFILSLGAKRSAQNFNIDLLGAQAFSSIKGAYMLRSSQGQNICVAVRHFEPECRSEQYLKGVIDDEARSVFQGSVYVHRSAQKTNGYQSHHALLPSPQAEARFKPELEIYADDVKCGHGATTGRLDPAALFYLQSRGIPLSQARDLLISAFLDEALSHIADLDIRNVCHEALEEKKKVHAA